MVRRTLKIAALALLTLVVLIVAALGSVRAYRQYRDARAPLIDTPNGIDEGMFIRIGAIDQWITVRGRDRANPVLLLLHGGPGAATSPLAIDTLAWEKDFTIVQWDQRGAGRTFGRSGRLDASVTIERMAQDGVEVAEFVRRHLKKDKIAIVGASWGTVLGVRIAKTRPDLLYAYVGTGQVVNPQKGEAMAYDQLLAESHARRNDGAIRELEAMGPPPYDSLAKLGVRSKWALAYEPGAPSLLGLLAHVLCAPRFTLLDFRDWFRGFDDSQTHFFGATMTGPMMTLDVTAWGTDFAIPMFVFQGADDNMTPTRLAKSYVDGIMAPRKQLVLIEHSGHLAMMTQRDEFLRLLLEWVRPLGKGG